MLPKRFIYLSCAVVALLLFSLGYGHEGGATSPSPAASEDHVSSEQRVAVLSGGCFWGVDAVFKHVKGVSQVVSGYSGGEAESAHYQIVSTGTTGHAESVQIAYNPAQVSYAQLLNVFFSVAHDPTELNRQGPDVGSQYRSAIFYLNDEQKRIAEAFIADLNTRKTFSQPIVTQVVPFRHFYPAEDYHQNYLALHPYSLYIIVNDMPKLAALQQRYPELYRDSDK